MRPVTPARFMRLAERTTPRVHATQLDRQPAGGARIADPPGSLPAFQPGSTRAGRGGTIRIFLSTGAPTISDRGPDDPRRL